MNLKNLNRRKFLTTGLSGTALLTLTGCSTFKGSKSDLDVVTSELRDLLESFEGDGARKIKLSALGLRIENRCQEVTQGYLSFRQRLEEKANNREIPTEKLESLIDEFTSWRERYRDELLDAQDELRQALTEEEWTKTVKILNAGSEAFSEKTKAERS